MEGPVPLPHNPMDRIFVRKTFEETESQIDLKHG
jgi:hypothetical protein